MKLSEYDSSMKDYMEKMSALVETHNYESPEKPGSLPTTVEKDDKYFRLIDTSHGFTCDTKHCQELFHMTDSLDNGLTAFYYPMLPIYTRDFKEELCALCINSGV